MDSETATYVIIAICGAIVLGAYAYLILVPAWTAYGRNWERVAAALLTLFVLAAFAGTGLGAGLVLLYYWDDITGLFGSVIPLGLEHLAALRIL
jgi:hypothetical protein